MENKYYTPNIEDFRVGYEYEFQGVPKGWHKMVFDGKENFGVLKYNLEKLSDAIRIPYLTKEQIEKEGWEFVREYPEGIVTSKFYRFKKVKNDYTNYIFDLPVTENWNFWVHIQEEIPNMHDANGNIIPYFNPIYNGKCSSINEFRYICKLLDIQ